MKFQPNIITSWNGYSKNLFLKDVLAGISVGVIALPLSMAFAIASGLTPAVGIFTAIISSICISMFGGCKVQIGGPAGAFIVIVYGILHKYGLPSLLISTSLSGFLLFFMGVFGLGKFIRLIPQSVINGFTSGIAVLILLSQLKEFLGLTIQLPVDFFGIVQEFYLHFQEFDSPTLLMSVFCLMFLFFWRQVRKYLGFFSGFPEILVVLGLSTAAVMCFHLPLETIGHKYGSIPDHFPEFVSPTFDLHVIFYLIVPIVTLTILGAIESLLCARVADGLTHDSHDPDQELMGQGIANFLLPFFGGMPATGTIARTVSNIKSGASSPVSGIVHAFTLFIIVYFLGYLAKEIPISCLAAILIYVALNMGDWNKLIRFKQFQVSDRIAMFSVFVLTVIFNLAVSITFGIGLVIWNHYYKKWKFKQDVS